MSDLQIGGTQMLSAAGEQPASLSNGAEHEDHETSQADEPTVLFRMLLQQLAEKDRQLAEKDKQISQLLEVTTNKRPEFIDIGWGAFNIAAIEVVGIWAEQDKPGDPIEPEEPRVRVFGESFSISKETLWYLYRVLGLPTDRAVTHDKFAAITDEDSCLNNALLSEPLFILRAQDQYAAQLVREWANLVESAGGGEEKVIGARAIADEMDAWGFHKVPD